MQGQRDNGHILPEAIHSVGLDGIAGLWMNWLEKATYIAPGGGKGGHEVRR